MNPKARKILESFYQGILHKDECLSKLLDYRIYGNFDTNNIFLGREAIQDINIVYEVLVKPS